MATHVPLASTDTDRVLPNRQKSYIARLPDPGDLIAATQHAVKLLSNMTCRIQPYHGCARIHERIDPTVVDRYRVRRPWGPQAANAQGYAV